MVKILITFEAEVNALNQAHHTPLDFALEMRQMEIVDLLVSVGGLTGDLVVTSQCKLPRLMSFKDDARRKVKLAAIEEVDSEVTPDHFGSSNSFKKGAVVNGVHQESSYRERALSTQSCESATLKDMEDGKTLTTLYERLQQCINVQLELSGKVERAYCKNLHSCS